MVIRKYRFPLVNIKYDVRVKNRKHKQTDDDQSRSVTTQMLYYSQSQDKFWVGDRPPQFGGGGQARGACVAPLKVLRIRSNLFAGTETLSLSVNEPIAKQILSGGTVPPIWEEGVELGGRMWYPVKAHHTGHNLLIETDTLSLLV